MNKELLTKPFDDAQIKQRQGAGRGSFDYVRGGDILCRLIEATDGMFDWTVTRLEFVSDGKTGFWLCEGTLSIPGLGVRSGIGTHQAQDLECPKAAETDALKRAAVKFGVALHLYMNEDTPQSRQASAQTNGAAGPSAAKIATEACPTCHAPAGKPHATTCTNR